MKRVTVLGGGKNIHPPRTVIRRVARIGPLVILAPGVTVLPIMGRVFITPVIFGVIVVVIIIVIVIFGVIVIVIIVIIVVIVIIVIIIIIVIFITDGFLKQVADDVKRNVRTAHRAPDMRTEFHLVHTEAMEHVTTGESVPEYRVVADGTNLLPTLMIQKRLEE